MLKSVLRAGLYWALVCGAIAATVSGMVGGPPAALVAAAIGGSCGGALASLLALTGNTRLKSFATASFDGRMVQTRSIVVDGSTKAVFDMIRKALLNARGLRLVAADAANSRMTARGLASWKSFGEIIRIELESCNAGAQIATRITITSRPRLPFTVADFAKNFENVEKLSRALAAINGPALRRHGKSPAAGTARDPSDPAAVR